MLGKARPGLTLYLREGLFPSLSVLIIGPLFSPTRAHNPWSTAASYEVLEVRSVTLLRK